ncbi:MAG: hypothetical protein ACYS7Y_30100 [Planctomycetota bacterium]|jgi:hypothetical protein
MKPLEGYTDVTDALIKKPCEVEDCTRTAELPTRYSEERHRFEKWYCFMHAYREFAKRNGKP